MMWGYGFSWMGMTLMMFGSVLGIVFLAILVWAVIRWQPHRIIGPTQLTNTLSERGPTAIEILNQRYARGDIDATTFEQMRQRLKVSDNVPPRSSIEEPRPAGEKLFD